MTTTTELKTPYAELLPPLSTEEFEALAADIRERGVQQAIDVDEHGKITGKKKTLALAGFMRQRGEADACMNRLLGEMDLLSFKK